MMPKVSLYIPCYNAEKYIYQCLESVLKQTYPIDEIIVIDDSLGDETAKIVSGYSVTLIRRRTRLGLPSARNLAFRQARNEFVAALDVDSIAEPEWLERLMANFSEGNIVGVGGKCIEQHTDTLADKWRAIYMKQHWGSDKIVNPFFLFGNNNVFRKETIIKLGFFDEVKYKRCYEDVDMSKRIKEAGFLLVYEPAAVVRHVRKDNIPSLLKTCWIWSFVGAGGKRTPDNFFNLCCKVYDNSLSLLSQVKKELKRGELCFLYIHILIFFHNIFCDFKYYICYRYQQCLKSR